MTTVLNASTRREDRKNRVGELAALGDQILAPLVVRRSGARLSLRELLTDLKGVVGNRAFRGVTPKTIYRVAPFQQLGSLPVTLRRPDAQPPGGTFQDFFPATEGQSLAARIRVPTVGENRPLASDTIVLYAEWGWWSIWPAYEHFSAKGRVAASGWDAADIVGGDRALAKQACLTLDTEGNLFWH